MKNKIIIIISAVLVYIAVMIAFYLYDKYLFIFAIMITIVFVSLIITIWSDRNNKWRLY